MITHIYLEKVASFWHDLELALLALHTITYFYVRIRDLSTSVKSQLLYCTYICVKCASSS